ncbi:MAG: copper amine oxidase N-terminal domain-containing protein [Lachnospirales bacterium]
MKFKTIFTTLFLAGLMSVNAFCAGINVVYNNEPVVFSDAQPKIINDRTMVPIRGLFEKLGFRITWDDLSKIATLRSDRITISASEEVLVCQVGSQFVDLDKSTMPVISEGRLYLPLRVIAQTTGCLVNWEAETKTVVIAKPEKQTAGDDEDIEYADEGSMYPNEQEYLKSLFYYLDEIKQELITSRDPMLMKLYNVNNTIWINKNSYDYSEIINNANKIKELTSTERMEDIKSTTNNFADIIISACSIASDSKIDEASLNSKISDLESQREGISLAFSMALVDFFNNNNVSYEKLFTEYCLDAMNY